MIYKGTIELENLFKGANEMEAVYLGDKEIWSNNKIIYLGEATSFNIRTLLPKIDPSILTNDNFFILSARASLSITDIFNNQVCQCRDYCVFYAGCGVAKNYNNGTLNLYSWTSNSGNKGCYSGGGSYAIKGVFVLKPEKLIRLGTGTSFNIRELLPNVDYTQLTADNFILRASGTASESTQRVKEHVKASVSLGASMSFTKSYNASTGVLNIGFSGLTNEVFFVKKIKNL